MDGFYVLRSASQLGALSAVSFLLSTITFFVLRRQRCGSIAVVALGGDATGNANKSINHKRKRKLKQHNTLKFITTNKIRLAIHRSTQDLIRKNTTTEKKAKTAPNATQGHTKQTQ